LGFVDMDINALRRQCELSHAGRRAAAPLFWTLGAQQVGKAAICGWQDMLGPALRKSPPPITVWPFSGSLAELLQPGQTVIAETYPAEFYQHLGVKFKPTKTSQEIALHAAGGKRSQAARQKNAEVLANCSSDLKIQLSDNLSAAIQDGFGFKPDGEDRFDAVIGLFGMLNILLGQHDPGEPEDEDMRKIEGWILGLTPDV
jgi:hypothetical protein